MLLVPDVMSQILSFYPEDLRAQVEREMPALALQAMQLGLEVMAAEQQGLRFCDAVVRPDFLKMGRLYFGAANLLQWRVPAEVRSALETIIAHAAAGGFDSARKVLFAIATRTGDPEAALYRFLLWVAARVNLLSLTWDAPEVEALGTLDEMESKAEAVLRDLLAMGEMAEPDVRPLNVLVAEMIIHTSLSLEKRLQHAIEAFGLEMSEYLRNAEALEAVRSLDARDAVLFWPGRSAGPIGSQQIADRYPQHFRSANAMEQRRSRLLKKRRSDAPPGDRLIDLIRNAEGGEK